METDKPKHGGKREGSGRKQQWGEPTKTIAFRIPASHEEKIRELVNAYLDNIKPSE